MIAPCKDCEDRHEHCHSTCEKYLEFRKIVDQIKKDRAHESDQVGYIVNKF